MAKFKKSNVAPAGVKKYAGGGRINAADVKNIEYIRVLTKGKEDEYHPEEYIFTKSKVKLNHWKGELDYDGKIKKVFPKLQPTSAMLNYLENLKNTKKLSAILLYEEINMW